MSSEEGGKETPLPNECPVCYEQFQVPNTSERRLSCSHSFCHDCLVKYLLTAKQEGSVKKNIICPLCRYVTFLSKRGIILPPKSGELHQILEVPISPSCQRHCKSTRTPNTVVIPISETEETAEEPELPACTCHTAISLEGLGDSFGSQVFIISDQGQPLACEAVAPAQSITLHPSDNICHSPLLIVILLLIFLVAVLAAVLPWILLSKKV
uniref:RING-type domain-containing protein n=1 Tax=Xenopus laevis TaxID=8355 RepID=A2RV95_XENLA|nr:Unknown (protein for MGC:161103) [Xenopus laevis]